MLLLLDRLTRLLNQLLALDSRLLLGAGDHLLAVLPRAGDDLLGFATSLGQHLFVLGTGSRQLPLHPVGRLDAIANAILPGVQRSDDRPERELPEENQEDDEGNELDDQQFPVDPKCAHVYFPVARYVNSKLLKGTWSVVNQLVDASTTLPIEP